MEIKMTPGGTPAPQDEYNANFMVMFEDFIVQASPILRAEIRARVEKAIAQNDRAVEYHKPYVEWVHAADLGRMYEGWGPNYLYVWLNDENIPFYAGQGRDRSRVEHFTSTTRSEKFKEVVRRGGCHAVVVARHIPSSKINNLERGLIAYLKWMDYPIVNDKDLPSDVECRMAKKIAKVGNLTMQQVFLSETEYRNDFAAIFTVLDGVVGVDWSGECAVFPTGRKEVVT